MYIHFFKCSNLISFSIYYGEILGIVYDIIYGLLIYVVLSDKVICIKLYVLINGYYFVNEKYCKLTSTNTIV